MKQKKVPNNPITIQRLSEEDWPLLELGDLRFHNLEKIGENQKKMRKKPRKRK